MADDNNKWSQPPAPPPPLFTGKAERDLVKQVNDELIERVVGQTVVYYPIDIENTNFHDLYGEAMEKTFLAPVRVYALVELGEISTKYNPGIGMDINADITVHFHKRRLVEDQDLYVREGDFLLYGTIYYEIVTLSESKQLFGQIDQRYEITAKCVKAREGTFDAS